MAHWAWAPVEHEVDEVPRCGGALDVPRAGAAPDRDSEEDEDSDEDDDGDEDDEDDDDSDRLSVVRLRRRSNTGLRWAGPKDRSPPCPPHVESLADEHTHTHTHAHI